MDRAMKSQNLLPLAKTLKIDGSYDPKHIAKPTKKWVKEKHTKVMEWPCQSPDLSPTDKSVEGAEASSSQAAAKKPKSFCKEE